MNLRQTLLRFIETSPEGSDRVSIDMGERSLDLYPRSPIAIDRALLFMGCGTPGRRLYVVAPPDDPVSDRFEGTCLQWAFDGEDQVRRCRLSPANAAVLRELLEWTRPRVLGLADSFGLGDRLGIAGPAHLRAMDGSEFEVVLAQQSIRELERTERTPDEVMNAATWAVVQEGWRSGFGADADHLKTPADVELIRRPLDCRGRCSRKVWKGCCRVSLSKGSRSGPNSSWSPRPRRSSEVWSSTAPPWPMSPPCTATSSK